MTPCAINPEEVGGGRPHIVLGPGDMPECKPLSIVIQDTRGGIACLSRWKPSPEERLALLNGADVLLYVWGWQVPVAIEVVSTDVGG